MKRPTSAIAIGLMGIIIAAVSARGEIAYFLLSTRLVGDSLGSCVLPLTKPEDIAEARRQMGLEQPTLIPVMRIATGTDGINRDYLEPGKPTWTWHVTEFITFAEGIIVGIESTLVLVERRLGGWDNETNGTVGFTGYKPVAELTPEQIFFTSASLTAGGVRLQWLDLGTNYLYTVESTASLSSLQWAPVPATTWPIAATNWVEAVATTNRPQFYRVKAELRNP